MITRRRFLAAGCALFAAPRPGRAQPAGRAVHTVGVLTPHWEDPAYPVFFDTLRQLVTTRTETCAFCFDPQSGTTIDFPRWLRNWSGLDPT